MTDVQILRAAACIATADGIVAPEERRVLDRLAHRAGVGAASLGAMIDQGLHDPGFRDDQLELIRGQTDRVLVSLFRTALADGELKDEERALLRQFAGKIDVPADRFDRLLSEAERLAREE